MTHIDDLPVDVWSIIFSNLSIENLFICRLVNKKFKNFSDNSNPIQKLVIGEPDLDGCDNNCDDYYWNYNNDPVEEKEKFSLEFFRAIKSLKLFNLDKKLKYLKIYDKEFKLNQISDLINLEVIEFGRKYFLGSNNIYDFSGFDSSDNAYESQIINSEKLKAFCIQLEEFIEEDSTNLYFELNTPKLQKIQFPDWNYIRLNSNPESIKHLITINYDKGLEVFKNLETLELRNTYQPLNGNVLIIFKKLKRLKINVNLEDAKYSDREIRNSLIKIFNNRTTLDREIDIFLEGNYLIAKFINHSNLNFSISKSKGIKIDNINKFNQEIKNITEESYWKIIYNNYELLDSSLPFINNLYYHNFNDCIRDVKNDLKPSFFDKYFNTNSIYVNGVKDINGLNWFLNNLKYPRAIYINCDVTFGQVFFNNLPNTIKVLHVCTNENVDYDIILKFPKLIKFLTNIDKDLFNLVVRSFGNLKHLKFFKFFYKKNSILVRKEGGSLYFNAKKIDFNQLVAECYRYRSQ